MLNADLIGFHIFEYARHFLTSCKRMLGLDFEFQEGGFLGVRDHKRNVMVQARAAGGGRRTGRPVRPLDRGVLTDQSCGRAAGHPRGCAG